MPTRRITYSGRASDALVTGVPHAGQKPRRIVLPESAVETNVVSAPVIATLSTSNTAFTVAEPEAQY